MYIVYGKYNDSGAYIYCFKTESEAEDFVCLAYKDDDDGVRVWHKIKTIVSSAKKTYAAHRKLVEQDYGKTQDYEQHDEA